MTGLRARVAHLPRETRDTLVLLCVIGWTVLPHATQVPPWCTGLTGLMLLWRAQLAWRGAPLPGRWWLVAGLLVACALTWWSFGTLLGREPGVTLAVMLMALKTLELRARRDAFVTLFLGFFLVLTQFLHGQSIAVAGSTVLAVWGLLTALVLAHMPVGRPPLAQAARIAGRTVLWGAPLMAVLFVLFPRIGPLWGVPKDGVANTGLSDSMRMGGIASVAEDESIAFRVRFQGAAPPPSALYFRGPVLVDFDGRTWRAASFVAPLSAATGLTPRAAETRYEMTLEPTRIDALPLLEATTAAPEIEGLHVRGRADLVWQADRPVLERVRFQATAATVYAYGVQADAPVLARSLRLPPGANPRTRAWAEALRTRPDLQAANATAKAQAVLRHIREGGYEYTLAPGGDPSSDPLTAIDTFWFDHRQGFCEHFAAAFVFALRAMDVPARVVTGYQGGDSEPVDGWHVVRQSAAHAWAEYWEPGRGWLRADPTAAVAPERILSSRALLPAPGFVAGALGAASPGLAARLRSAWDAVDNRWNQLVLNYARGQQFDLLRQIGIQAPDWEDLARLLGTVLATLALAGAAWAWWERRRTTPWSRQMAAVRAALLRAGLQTRAHEGPRTLARRLRSELGREALPAALLLDALDTARYGRDAPTTSERAWLRRFHLALRPVLRRARH